MERLLFRLILFFVIFIFGCEDEEVAKIKAHGYVPPIPEYNTSDMCVNFVNNSSTDLSPQLVLGICFRQEYRAKDELTKMQKEGKVIRQERWMSCLEYAAGPANGSYSVLHECAIGKIEPGRYQSIGEASRSQTLEGNTKNSIQSQPSGKVRTPQIEQGKKLHLKIITKYPSLGKEYKEPFISGGLTSNPICLISVPAKEWANLSDQQKLQLFDYAASLIPEVKANPEKYSGLGPNAPVAPRVRQNIARMGNESWAVDVGEFTNGGRDLLSGNFIKSLK